MARRVRPLRRVALAGLLAALGALTAGPAAGGARPAAAAPLDDASTTLIVVDSPRGGTSGPQLAVSGWAADPGSPSGTGVDRVDVYLDGEPGTGTLLGRATYGLQRSDVAANLGSSRFTLSGFALAAQVPPGPHTVYVYAHPSDQPPEQGWSLPKTAAVLVGPGGPGGTLAQQGGPWAPGPLVEGPPPPSGITIRQAGITGSYTLGQTGPIGANYPPGPADSGGPIVAPTSFGWGLYGPPQPFPDYPLYYSSAYGGFGGGFDFSLGTGYDFYSPSYLANLMGNTLVSPVPAPWRWRNGWGGLGPLYCPVYSYC
jgi:hypothetical protein